MQKLWGGWVLGPHQVVLRDHFWFCTQKVLLGGLYRLQRIIPRLTDCKTNALSTVLSTPGTQCKNGKRQQPGGWETNAGGEGVIGKGKVNTGERTGAETLHV